MRMRWLVMAAGIVAVMAPRGALADALSIGTVKAVGDEAGITISLSAGLSGGSGAGYHYAIYRGATPTFVGDNQALLATVDDLSAKPYRDTTSPANRAMRYYRVVGSDGAGATVSATPEGFGPITPARPMPVSACLTAKPVNVVFIGDSITQGVGAPDGQHAAPALCAEELHALLGGTAVYFSNQGHSGHTTQDYLPGGQDYAGAQAAARALMAAHPGTLIFSIMLGTNDSANGGPHDAPLPAEGYRTNLKALLARLAADFPSATTVVQHPLWYSPNTHNGCDYELTGLERLTTYDAVIHDVATHSGAHVREGDTRGFAFFAANYLTDLAPENGQNGTFYLHPNARGAANLARLWAVALIAVR